MPTKRADYDVIEFKADSRDGHKGEFSAYVSVFGNVDRMGDRVMPNAFDKTLDDWRTSGDRIPILWSHDHSDPFSHIGSADPHDVVADEKGLLVKRGVLDIADNPKAAQAFKLLNERRVKQFSFMYEIVDENIAKDGANNLNELKLLEAGPTFVGANPATELVGTKDDEVETKAGARHSRATQTALAELRAEVNARIDALLGADDAADEPKSQPEAEEPTATADESERATEPTVEKDREPTAKSDIDEEILALSLRIEEIRRS